MQDVFRHEALPYAGRSEFASSCAGTVRGGLDRDERVIVLAADEKVADVRDELGAAGEDVTFVTTDQHGRNPGRITTLLHSFQAAGAGRPSLGVNESVVAGRSPAAQLEAQLADVMFNRAALGSCPMSVVCLYDANDLDAPTVQTVQQGHEVIRGQDANPHYRPDLAETLYARPLEPAPDDAARLVVRAPDLGDLRSFVRSAAQGYGIAGERTDDLVLAANEIVTNSLRYGGGTGHVAMWSDDDSAICEVADLGHIRDPLAGRIAPPPDATSGRGLWLANHLCDLVQLRTSPAGTVVRLHVDA